jgi:hypothetical protein
MKLHEYIGPDGERVEVRLLSDGASLVLDVGGDSVALPDGSLEAVMRRLGRPMEAGVEYDPLESLDLGERGIVRRFRFLSRYDVVAKDYVVFLAPGAEPLCELATSVCAALDFLGRRFGELKDDRPLFGVDVELHTPS